MKNLYLANPRGFCSGVTKAIKLVNETLENYSLPIYIYNEIVHNKTIVKYFEDKGIQVIKDINQLPGNSVVIFSAHGVSPHVHNIAGRKTSTIIDATCPIVKRVHNQVHHYAKSNIYIVYIGHKKHEEVVGVYGEDPASITIVESKKDIKSIPKDKKEYAVLSQTTLNASFINEMLIDIKEFLSNKVVDEQMANVCFATTARQDAVKKLAQNVDIVYILGSQNSSNANRLQEIAANSAVSFLIENKFEINLDDIEPCSKIGISSGASTPDFLVDETVKYLQSKFEISLLK